MNSQKAGQRVIIKTRCPAFLWIFYVFFRNDWPERRMYDIIKWNIGCFFVREGRHMKKFSRLFWPLLIVLWCIVVAMYLLGFYLLRRTFFYVGAALTLTALLLLVVGAVYINRRIRKYSLDVSSLLSTVHADALDDFPMPVIVLSENGEIMWYNRMCHANVFRSDEMNGRNISEFFTTISFQEGRQSDSVVQLSYQNSKYTGYILHTVRENTKVNLLYLVDDTELKSFRERYLRTRITVMVIMIDNYEELLQSARENGTSQMVPEIEYAIERYMKGYGGLLCRLERDRFIAFVEESAMQQIIASRFSLLDTVRKMEITQRQPATLSIGVGQHAASLTEAEKMARQALDMSLGRGGDQAAIKTQAGYEFYGGVSKGVEKRTKVKTRIVATALAELITGSSNVIIMGHRFSDLDCIGSAVGLYKAVRILGKEACIAIHGERTLAGPLIEKLRPAGYGEVFREPESLLDSVNQDTLLIVVDVHSKNFLESRELYEKCRSVVVIDHHRKMVDYIDNAVIFYHEPYASSASEMVSELVQYFDMPKNLGRIEAEALLSGIMLDTKNFVMKSGVRTFEAAAYLKRLGADTVEVRRLFSSPMEDYQKRARIVSSATVYHRCAIAMSPGMVEDIKLVAPQAADELLSITNVDASFVLFETPGQVEISARSMGAVNVQLVMERMGGGGHLNMAAAQIREADIEDVYQRLLGAIDDYFDTLEK